MDQTTNSTTTHTWNPWSTPELVETRVYDDRIEMIYTETSMVTSTVLTEWNNEPTKRVFKVVYSVKDCKWHQSERIYGKVISPRGETYEFPEE